MASDQQGVPPTARRMAAAWGLAIAVDVLQWALLPLMAEGALSPVNLAIDLGMALLLSRWLGFHWSYLPTFGLESLPLVDLAPTWTAAVWMAARRNKANRRDAAIPPLDKRP